jgi:hypothetical protein
MENTLAARVEAAYGKRQSLTAVPAYIGRFLDAPEPATVRSAAQDEITAAVVAELRDLAGDPIGNLADPHSGEIIDLVREVLLNRAHDLEGGAA